MRARSCLLPALAIVASACGLLAPPGEYASGPSEGASGDGGTADARAPDATVLPDGNVVTPPSGRIAVLAGERDPAGPEDNPAWTSDCYVADLAADGRVTGWTIDKSAPVIGSFDATTILSGSWVSLSVGFGIANTRASTLQLIGWSPGPTGAWRAARANMPGGLDEVVRVFFGAHVAIVGGVRTTAIDGGTTSAFTKEVHVADVDVTQGTLGGTEDSGTSLNVARARPGVLVANDKLYVAGGRAAGASPTASVEMARVDPQAGSVGAFVEQPALQNDAGDVRVIRPLLVVAEGWLFAAGGSINATGTPSDVVLASKIDPATGALAPWKGVASLPRPLRDFAFVARGDVLYVIGGQAGAARSDDVSTAKVAADGTLSPWESAGNAKLPAPRSDLVGVVY